MAVKGRLVVAAVRVLLRQLGQRHLEERARMPNASSPRLRLTTQQAATPELKRPEPRAGDARSPGAEHRGAASLPPAGAQA